MPTLRTEEGLEVKVNGEEKSVPDDPISIADLLKLFNVESPDMVSVQLNNKFVPRNGFDLTKVRGGDTIDFLYSMGGGGLVGVETKITTSGICRHPRPSP
jgi:sulfur carrier protein